jgi:glycerate kinase
LQEHRIVRAIYLICFVNVLIAPDKFKGSLSAMEVCLAVANGLAQIDTNFVVQSVPLADGGEGTCDLLTQWHKGTKVQCIVHGPLFSRFDAHYGISQKGDSAFIETAMASGLSLLQPSERNPLFTTTLGTGELIADALNRNVKRIILGLGGSATNDAGMGMATALGYQFFDKQGELLKPIGENLIHLHHIQQQSVHPRLKRVEFIALCDVTNPLYGPGGAAFIYGPQKGASFQDVQLLDAGLRNFRRVVHKSLKARVDFPGAGAAGGLGAGAKVFLHAAMQKGIEHMTKSTDLEYKIKQADLIITGEGKIDQQTFSGKVVSEVTRLGLKSNKRVIAICGTSEITETELRAQGIEKVISLVDAHTTPESAIQNAVALISSRIALECKYLLNA